MKPAISGYYKVDIEGNSLFAYYSTHSGWNVWGEPTSWQPIEYVEVNDYNTYKILI